MHRLLMIAPLLLTACSGAAVGPSLAKRPIEDRSMAEPVRAIPPPAPADAALQGQIAGLIDRARTGQREFSALLPRVQAAAGAAGSDGSESWIAAQQLLSALEGLRAPTTAALGELDALVATRLNNGTEAGMIELQAADAEVAELVEGQRRALDSLRARIAR